MARGEGVRRVQLWLRAKDVGLLVYRARGREKGEDEREVGGSEIRQGLVATQRWIR